MMAKLNLPYTLLTTLCYDSEEIDFFTNHLCRKILNSIVVLLIQLLEGGNALV